MPSLQTNASLSGELVHYTLHTSSYSAEYYNLTVSGRGLTAGGWVHLLMLHVPAGDSCVWEGTQPDRPSHSDLHCGYIRDNRFREGGKEGVELPPWQWAGGGVVAMAMGKGGVVTMVMGRGGVVSAVKLSAVPGLLPYVIGIIGGVAGAVLVVAVLILIVAMAAGYCYHRRNARAVIGKVGCCHMTIT